MAMTALIFSARLLLAAVFVIAAISKLRNLSAFKERLARFAAPERLRGPLTISLPLVEIAVGILLLLPSTTWWSSVTAVLMLGVFTIIILRNLARGNRPECNCFGQLNPSPIGPGTVTRNLFLGLCGVFIIWQGAHEADPSIAQFSIQDVVNLNIVLMLGSAAISVALVGEAWIIFHLLRQQGRMLLRVDNLELQLEAAGVKPLMDTSSTKRGLPTGLVAPSFTLPLLRNGVISLEDLKEFRRPIILVFSDPACAACEVLMPELAQWEREHRETLTIAIVTSRSTSSAYDVNAKINRHGFTHVLVQNDREVADRYQAMATPSAVMINGDGLIGTPLAVGAEQISALFSFALSKSVGGASSRRGLISASSRPIGTAMGIPTSGNSKRYVGAP